jgi:serine/threonine-protein kinase
MATGNTDRNLLFGILALQMDFINRDALINAMSAWALAKSKPIGHIFVEQGTLSESRFTMLDALVEEHLKLHGNDPQRSLASVSSIGSVRQDLEEIADADLHASLAHLPAAAPGDSDATRAPSMGVSTSTGLRFRVLRPHARGGLGVVSVAHDEELHREVALKEIQGAHADDPQSRARFVLEAEITGGLEHPGIVPVYGLGHDPTGRPFYAMRFIRGNSLREAIDRFHAAEKPGRDPGERALALRELLGRFVDVCNAIAYAHSRGVLHRDLKPGNIMLGQYGETLVVDWGLAKPLNRATKTAHSEEGPLKPSLGSGVAPTEMGSAVGTPQFMSPEQAAGVLDQLGPASDVYSLGATLYCLLTGRPPFDNAYVGEVLQKVRHGKFPPPRARKRQIAPALEAICLQAMALKPADRHATPRALADDVEHWLADERVSAYRDSLTTRLTRWGRRHRTSATAAAVALLATLGGLGAVLWVQQRANADLEAKNHELAEQQKEVEARFELAQKAIATFHTGVSEDALLKNRDLAELRTKLLKQAASFYGDLENLLAGKTDAKSRKLLADGYFQLGELTEKIGDRKEALAVQRKALSLRRELAAMPGADMETRLEVARGLLAVGNLLSATGDKAGALAAFEEQRDLAESLAAESPSDGAQVVLAQSHNGIAIVLARTGKPGEALQSFENAHAIRQKLADANPASIGAQSDLATSYNNIGLLLSQTGRPREAFQAYEKARDIFQKLTDANHTVTDYRSYLAASHYNIGELLAQMGRPGEALQAYEKARDIFQKLTDANPIVPKYQRYLAQALNNLGRLQGRFQRFAEAFHALDQAVKLGHHLADAHRTNTDYQTGLGQCHAYRGWAQVHAGHPAEAAADLRRAVELWAKDNSLDLETRFEQSRALALLAGLGREAKSGVTAAEAATFADRAVAAVRGAIRAGWAKPDELKEPDFASLWQRDEFQKLQKEVEAKAAANRQGTDKQPEPGKK